MMLKKKILIIGGNGFLGQGILKATSKDKYEISIVDQFFKKNNLKKYQIKHLFKCSILNNTKMNQVLNKEKWDCIIYLAAFGGNGNGLLKAANEDFSKAININVNAFANLLNILKTKKVRVNA